MADGFLISIIIIKHDKGSSCSQSDKDKALPISSQCTSHSDYAHIEFATILATFILLT